MDKSIRVRILNREYPLRVREADAAFMQDVAADLDARIQAFKQAFPDQTDLVAAVMTALSMAEELHHARESEALTLALFEEEIDTLTQQLGEAMALGKA